MLDKQSKSLLADVFRRKENAVVITHLNPDGDAIGSSLALAIFLKKLEIPVSVIIPNEVPDFLKWLPGFEYVHTYKDNSAHCLGLLEKAKTIFLLDLNEPERTGKLRDAVIGSRALKFLIDHHQNPQSFADVMISRPWRGSTGEMIFLLIEETGYVDLIDHDIATSLYVAIMTDTGNFRYGCSYSELFSIVGKLVDIGIDKDQIFTSVYDSYSIERMKLMGYCMSEKLVVLPDYHAAYISITREELKRFKHRVGDTEGFVNIPFSIKGIKVTALFVEKKDHIKISLRSKGEFSVADLASAYFNGGGHINAAGGELKSSMAETIALFESKLSEYRDELA